MTIRDVCQSYNSPDPLVFEKTYDEKLSFTLTIKCKIDKVMVSFLALYRLRTKNTIEC